MQPQFTQIFHNAELSIFFPFKNLCHAVSDLGGTFENGPTPGSNITKLFANSNEIIEHELRTKMCANTSKQKLSVSKTDQK